MIFVVARKARRIAVAGGTALLAFAAPLFAQPLDLAAFDAQQRQILDRIENLQRRDGPYAPALLDQLKALIALYRESSDDALAIVAIERALQVVRANSGLYSLEQVPLLWQRIASEEARGNDAEVWDLEQELLTLVRRHPDDLQAAAELRRIADRQRAVLARVVHTGEIPPQVVYGCFYKEWPNSPGGSCTAGERSTVVQGMLAETDRNYADAIAILLRNDAYSSAELRDLELELLRGAELIHAEYEARGITGARAVKVITVPLVPLAPGSELREPWKSRMAPIEELADWELPFELEGTPEEDFVQDFEPRDLRFRDPYYRGRQSLRRLYGYAVVAGGRPAARAAALVDLADWDLLFSRNGLAVEGYALARRVLEEARADEQAAARLFRPALPVVLPSFEPNPLARDETRVTTGHIDVSFAVTKYGNADDIEILGVANADARARTDLIALLKSSRFRPRYAGARDADTTPVEVRYYLQDAPGSSE